MSKKTTIATTLVKSAMDIANNDSIQKMLFGTYADGSTRSFIDSLNGEILSPNTKKKYIYKKKNKKKNKNKIKF